MDYQHIERFRQRSESDDHWVLRKEFIQTYWNDFPEGRLLCLAQVYSNMVHLGCSYPDDVMHQVHQLTRNLPEYKDFRERHKQMASVPFVRERKSAKSWDNSGTSQKRAYSGASESFSHKNKSSHERSAKKLKLDDSELPSTSKRACSQVLTNVSGGFTKKKQFVPPKDLNSDNPTDCENVLQMPEVITLEDSNETALQMDTLPKSSNPDRPTDCENSGMHSSESVLQKTEVITLEDSSETVLQADTLPKSSNHDGPTDCENAGTQSSKDVLQKPEVITLEVSSETVLQMDTLPKSLKDNYKGVLQFIKKALTKQQIGLEILNNMSQKFRFKVEYSIKSVPEEKDSIPSYECSVEIEKKFFCKAKGLNKKAARSEAGKLAIDLLMKPPKKVKSVDSILSDEQCVSVNSQSVQDEKLVSRAAKNNKSDDNNNYASAGLNTKANLLVNQCGQNSLIQKSTTENVCRDSLLPLNSRLEGGQNSPFQKSTTTDVACRSTGLPLDSTIQSGQNSLFQKNVTTEAHRDTSSHLDPRTQRGSNSLFQKNVKPESCRGSGFSADSTIQYGQNSLFQKNTTAESHRNTSLPLDPRTQRGSNSLFQKNVKPESCRGSGFSADSTIQYGQNSLFQKNTTAESHRNTSLPLDPRTQRGSNSLFQKNVTTESHRYTGFSADSTIQYGQNSFFQKNTTSEAHRDTSSPLDPRTQLGWNSPFQKNVTAESRRYTGFSADSRIQYGQNSLFQKNTTTEAYGDTSSTLDPRTRNDWNSLNQKNVTTESRRDTGFFADPRIQCGQNSLFQKNTATVAHRDTSSSLDPRTQHGRNSLFQKNTMAESCRDSDFSADPRIQYGQYAFFQKNTTNEAHGDISSPLDPRIQHSSNSLFQQNSMAESRRDTGFSADLRTQYNRNSLFQKTATPEAYRDASSSLGPRTQAGWNSLFQKNAADVDRNTSLFSSSRNSAPFDRDYITNVNQSRRCTSNRAAFYSSYFPSKQNSSVTDSFEYQMEKSCNMDSSSQNPFPEFIVILDHSDANKSVSSSSVFMNSANFNHVPFQFEYEVVEKDKLVGTRANIILGGRALCSGTGENRQVAKEAACEAALSILKKTAYTVKVKDEHDDGFTVSRSQVFGASESHNTVSENSIGCKMLKMMGWSGGGIGKAGNKGIEEPVKAVEKHKFGQGLGYANNRGNDASFTARVEQIIQDYARSNSTSDIIFSTEFSKDERKEVHRIATKYGLKNNSKGGKGDGRHLVISRRYKPHELVNRLLEAGGSTYKYELLQPTG